MSYVAAMGKYVLANKENNWSLFPTMHTPRSIGMETAGTHWAVLIVDCRDKEALQGRILDSICNTQIPINDIQRIALRLLGGLNQLTTHSDRVYPQTPHLIIGSHTLHQRTNNKCTEDGGSACGPFGFAITEEFTQYIVECCEDNVALNPINIALPAALRTRWQWDLNHTRAVLANLVRRVKTHICTTHELFDSNGGKGVQDAAGRGECSARVVLGFEDGGGEIRK
jgi:hypothetical protein